MKRTMSNWASEAQLRPWVWLVVVCHTESVQRGLQHPGTAQAQEVMRMWESLWSRTRAGVELWQMRAPLCTHHFLLAECSANISVPWVYCECSPMAPYRQGHWASKMAPQIKDSSPLSLIPSIWSPHGKRRELTLKRVRLYVYPLQIYM